MQWSLLSPHYGTLPQGGQLAPWWQLDNAGPLPLCKGSVLSLLEETHTLDMFVVPA